MRYHAKIGIHNKQRYVMPVSQTLLLQFVISFMDVDGKWQIQGLIKNLSASALQSRAPGRRSGHVTDIGSAVIVRTEAADPQVVRHWCVGIPPSHIIRNQINMEHLIQPAVHTGITFTDRLTWPWPTRYRRSWRNWLMALMLPSSTRLLNPTGRL